MEELITVRHIELMGKVILATGSMVGYAYAMEFFIAYYGGNPYELFAFKNRAFGPYWWAYWIMVTCNVISPQLFWFKKIRTNLVAVFILSICVNIGMWFERFVIVVTSLHRDFLPSNWGYYSPDPGGYSHVRRHLRPVPDPVPAVPAVRAADRHRRGQERHPAGRSRTIRWAARKEVTATRCGGRRPELAPPAKQAAVRLAGGVRHRRRDQAGRRPGAGRRLPALGCLHALSRFTGMDDAMGLRDSRVGWFTFVGGVPGFAPACR